MAGWLKHPVFYLGLLAGLAWLLVLLQALVMGVRIVELATAMLFTSLLIAWPFMAGWRRKPTAWIHVPPCRECGLTGMGAQAFGFCIRCGALPKPDRLRQKVGSPSRTT